MDTSERHLTLVPPATRLHPLQATVLVLLAGSSFLLLVLLWLSFGRFDDLTSLGYQNRVAPCRVNLLNGVRLTAGDPCLAPATRAYYTTHFVETLDPRTRAALCRAAPEVNGCGG